MPQLFCTFSEFKSEHSSSGGRVASAVVDAAAVVVSGAAVVVSGAAVVAASVLGASVLAAAVVEVSSSGKCSALTASSFCCASCNSC